jgi:hypothetical protein
MPDLGKKFTCYNCSTKFYNLGKPEAICPKCGANQKNAKSDDAPPPVPRPPRRQILMEPVSEDNAPEFGEEGPAPEEDAADRDEDELDEEPELRVKERADEEEF